MFDVQRYANLFILQNLFTPFLSLFLNFICRRGNGKGYAEVFTINLANTYILLRNIYIELRFPGIVCRKNGINVRFSYKIKTAAKVCCQKRISPLPAQMLPSRV